MIEQNQNNNMQPVIGIVSQSCHPDITAFGNPALNNYSSYIMAGYVRFLESFGARVIPILHDDPIEVSLSKMEHINGLLFPGGAGDYVDNGKQMFMRAL